MRGKKRPTTERARAVGIALIEGIPAAAKATGVPARSLRRYKDDPELAVLGLSVREDVEKALWVGIQVGLDQVLTGLADPDERLRDKADAVNMLMTQHALLTGQATMRSETRDLTSTFEDHELDELRTYLERNRVTSQHPAEVAVASPGQNGAAPSDG